MLPRMLRLVHPTWPQALRLARGRRSSALLPLGATEQHGPYPPMSVDLDRLGGAAASGPSAVAALPLAPLARPSPRTAHGAGPPSGAPFH